MPTVPFTGATFADLVRKSRLVPENALESALNDFGPGKGPKSTATRLVRRGLLTKYQAGELLRGKYRGFFVGKYKILEPLGSGGMGSVYLAEHLVLRGRFALKLLAARYAYEPALVRRFLREARATAALNHSNVVRAFDVDRKGEYHYLVMEFIDGVTLKDLVARRGPLDPVRSAHYVAQAARGLQHVHDHGLVHRDLKPGNLMLDRSGVVKVLDLGLVRYVDERSDLITRKYDSTSILGTADFLSPEQARRSESADARGDLYSLGATWYFLLAGRPPFTGGIVHKLMQHQLEDPEPLTRVRPEVPAKMAAVVARLMAKRPEDRFQTPAALSAALEGWLRTPLPPPDPADFPVRGASPVVDPADADTALEGSVTRVPANL